MLPRDRHDACRRCLHATVFVACQKEQRAVLLGYILLWFWGIFCCGMCVVAASLASNDNFNTNNAEASAANFSVCNTHSDCFAIGATCLSSVPAEIIDNLAHRPCLTCSASYNVGTAPRMCINGACCCTSDSVVFGVVPRVHLAQYEHSTCGHEGSNCHVELKL